MSAILRKSVTDLTRRKARSAFAVLTLALAVASVGIFAVPSLMTKAMQREIARNRLADVTVTFRPLALTNAQVARLGRLPNVTAVGPKSLFPTRIYAGARRQKAIVVGVPDFGHQRVDVVAVASGAPPIDGGVLTDTQNARGDKFAGGRGAVVRVVAADNSVQRLAVTGEGRNLDGGTLVTSANYAVFYASQQTVARMSGARGYTQLGFRLRDTSRAAANRTVGEIRAALRSVPGFSGFTDLPTIRAAGSYPGKALFDQLASMMNVVTLLALLSALVLLASTMSTLIGEQTGEIGTMKAIGARRAQIRRVYLRTAMLLGGLGALLGAALGVLVANAVTGYFGMLFFGIGGRLAVDGPVLAASVVVGLAGPPLAALPAIRRAARVPVHDALRATGSATGGQGAIDAGLRHVGFLPRSAQIGLRSLGRRKRRTLGTAVQIALAVGTLLGLLSLGTGLGKTTKDEWNRARWDISVSATTSRPFDARAQRLVAATPGVRRVQPVLLNGIKVGGDDAYIQGLPEAPLMSTATSSGRWYSAAEASAGARVAIIGRALADTQRKGVGDTVTVTTAAGPASFRVIGISDVQFMNGQYLTTPLKTLRGVLHTANANVLWVQTTSPDHGLVDRTTTRIEDLLAANGNHPNTEIRYVGMRDNVAQNKAMTTGITVLGLLIVAISLVGLVNTITMGVLERTREIGMLRCVGARARDVRRIFATEGLVVALLGWLLGIPAGYALGRAMIALTESVVHVRVAFVFPTSHLAIALFGTVVLALVVLAAPVRRAVRFKPGEALRYA
jgi:putative ABC transport system permease protein